MRRSCARNKILQFLIFLFLSKPFLPSNLQQKAVLVVVSDGRGNVPLEASHVGKIKLPVGKKGVEDALEVAEKISNLANLETIFLNPQSKQYPDLPLLLAKALGAKILSIPPVENWEITSHN